MLLIGGASCAGKSTLARTLARHCDAQSVDTDLFWMVLRRTAPPTMASDIQFLASPECWSLPLDALVELHLRVSRSVCYALEAVVDHYAAVHVRAILEGTWLLPSFATQDIYAGRQVGAVVRSLFLHESSVGHLRQRLLVRDDGWRERPAPSLHAANVEMQRLYGDLIAADAQALGLPVLESRPFETLPERALAALAAGRD